MFSWGKLEATVPRSTCEESLVKRRISLDIFYQQLLLLCEYSKEYEFWICNRIRLWKPAFADNKGQELGIDKNIKTFRNLNEASTISATEFLQQFVNELRIIWIN